jgi:inosine/xanthosine triphosphatase
MSSLIHPATIAVGSLNPVKITAVQQAVARVWPTVQLHGIDVPSGVSAMPMNDEETLRGARNRAAAARERLGADLGIGLEGGVSDGPAGLLLMAWVAVVDGNGRAGIGNSARIPLPPDIARRVRNGAELGPLMDQLLHTQGINQKEGVMGILTAGLVPRGAALAMAVAFALAPFVAPQFYHASS